MRCAPWWVVAPVVSVAVVLAAVGGVTHIGDFARHGLRPYDWAPAWLNLYWTSLAVLDLLAAWLLIRGKRSGMDLACAIMVTDVAANVYGVYGIQQSSLAAQPGLQRLMAFGVLTAAVALSVRRYLR